MIDLIATSFSLIVLISYIIVLFLLFEVKIKCTGKISVAFTYFITTIIFLIVIRILNLLSKSDIFSVPYLHEILVVIMSSFLLMTALSFYSVLKSVTDRKRKPLNKKYIEKIRYKTQKYKSLRHKFSAKPILRSKIVKKKEPKDTSTINRLKLAKNLFRSKSEKKVALKRLRKQSVKTTKKRAELKKLMSNLGESV